MLQDELSFLDTIILWEYQVHAAVIEDFLRIIAEIILRERRLTKKISLGDLMGKLKIHQGGSHRRFRVGLISSINSIKYLKKLLNYDNALDVIETAMKRYGKLNTFNVEELREKISRIDTEILLSPLSLSSLIELASWSNMLEEDHDHIRYKGPEEISKSSPFVQQGVLESWAKIFGSLRW